MQKIGYICVGVDVSRLIFAIQDGDTFHIRSLYEESLLVRTETINSAITEKDRDRGKIPNGFQSCEWYSNIRPNSPTYRNLVNRFSRGRDINHISQPTHADEIEQAKKDLTVMILEGTITFQFAGDRIRLLRAIKEGKNSAHYDDLLKILGFTYNIVKATDYDFGSIASVEQENDQESYQDTGRKIRPQWERSVTLY